MGTKLAYKEIYIAFQNSFYSHFRVSSAFSWAWIGSRGKSAGQQCPSIVPRGTSNLSVCPAFAKAGTTNVKISSLICIVIVCPGIAFAGSCTRKQRGTGRNRRHLRGRFAIRLVTKEIVDLTYTILSLIRST